MVKEQSRKSKLFFCSWDREMRGVDGVKLKASDTGLDFEERIAPCGHGRGYNMLKVMGA